MRDTGLIDGHLDVYGFKLECSEEDMETRRICDLKQAHQLQAWEKYWKRKKLPTGEKLKKLCRKVSNTDCSQSRAVSPITSSPKQES